MTEKMKTIPYGHQYIDKEDIESVLKVLRSDWLTQGPMVEKFERVVADYCGAKYAVAVSNGTAALHIACLAAGIKKDDEVITSPITFVASANCIVYCGGKPVFADVQADIPNIDPKEIEKKITKKAKAIIPVHYSGHPCDMREIHQIANKNKLTVIEDGAHALGAEYSGSKIGSCRYSDMTTFSFHPVKHITTGEGGMVTTNSRRLYERLLLFRNHGITKNRKKIKKCDEPWYYEQQVLGYNYRITDFQCALGISQLQKLNKFIKKRRKIVKIYNKRLSELKGVDLPIEKNYVSSAWHLYYIRIKAAKMRRAVFEKLTNSGIGCQVHYIPVYLQPYYKKHGYMRGLCPNAEKFYRSEITIPLFQGMSSMTITKIVGALVKILSNSAVVK